MASADLTSARELIDRAQQQFDALKTDADAFPEKNGWTTDVKRHKNGWVLRARIRKQPPEGWWIDVGQLAGHARSALDHLVFQLAVHNGSNPSEDRTQFPIFETKEDYVRGGTRSWRERMLAGVADGDRKIIDKSQPYTWGKNAPNHPLAMLRSLNDRHKHRERHVGAALLERYSVRQMYGSGLGVGMTIGQVENPEPVLDKHIIFRAYPEAKPQREVPTPPDAVARGWPATMTLMGDLVSLEPGPDFKFTVGFYGDRSFRLEDVGTIPPYVSKLIRRFERRIARKSPRSRPSR